MCGRKPLRWDPSQQKVVRASWGGSKDLSAVKEETSNWSNENKDPKGRPISVT